MVTHEPDIAQFAKRNMLFREGRSTHTRSDNRKNAMEELKNTRSDTTFKRVNEINQPV